MYNSSNASIAISGKSNVQILTRKIKTIGSCAWISICIHIVLPLYDIRDALLVKGSDIDFKINNFNDQEKIYSS